jgi:SAM-dependent methyltransferase
MPGYDEVLAGLRAAYDSGASRREAMAKPPWKLAERESFVDRLREAGATHLLEVGAGSGQDGLFFAESGLTVVATDLAPAMVEYCRAKGLDARVADVLSLGSVFEPGTFDAIYTANCLLHVPDADLPAALQTLAGLLRPAGLMYLGVWGGRDFEGHLDDEDHEPKRFFAWRTDERLLDFVARDFEVVEFHTVEIGYQHHYQSLTLRRRPAGA